MRGTPAINVTAGTAPNCKAQHAFEALNGTIFAAAAIESIFSNKTI